MKLLYVYLDFTKNGNKPRGFRGLKECELNFSTTHIYSIKKVQAKSYKGKKKKKNTVYRVYQKLRKSEDMIECGFWGDNRIYNVTAIVGENGTGKSTLIESLFQILQHFDLPENKLRPTSFNFAYLFEDDSNKLNLIYCDPSKRSRFDLSLLSSDAKFSIKNEQISAQPPLIPWLQKTKLVYFSNAVSSSEIYKYSRSACFLVHPYDKSDLPFVYDCSLLARMLYSQRDKNNSIENFFEVELSSFFDFELSQEFWFLFNSHQRKNLLDLYNLGYPVPFPQELKISFSNPVDRLLEVMNFWKTEYCLLDNDDFDNNFSNRRNFKINVDNKTDGMIIKLSFHCLVNSLEIISGSVTKNDIEETNTIDLILNAFNKDKKVYTEDTFITIIAKLKGKIADKNTSNILDKHTNFIQFLWKNVKSISTWCKYHKNDGYVIELGDVINKDLYIFVTEFFTIYQVASYPYSFLNWSWGLSSGESALLSLFSSLYYLLSPSSNKKNVANKIVNRVKENDIRICDSIILLLDEPDISLHPEWQRTFIATLVEYLPRLYKDPYDSNKNCGCKNIQIILTTHSPLMLGDFPSASVIYLKKDKDNSVIVDSNKDLQPFGQNIYTLLNDAFFLKNGTIGKLAQRKIQAAVDDIHKIRDQLNDCMEKQKKSLDLSYSEKETQERYCAEWETTLQNHYRLTVKYLPDGIVRNKLEEEIRITRAMISGFLGSEKEREKEYKKRMIEEEIERLKRLQEAL